MASLQQKRPSISNWFSSLRRQPKNTKNAGIYGEGDNKSDEKHKFQRSCFDLRTNNSTFYITPPADNDHANAEVVPSESPTALAGCIDELQDDNRCELINNKQVTQFCMRCSSDVLPPSCAKIPTEKKAPRSPSMSPFTSVATYKIPDTPKSLISPTLSMLSSLTETDVSNNVQDAQMPNSEFFDTEVLNKRAEFTNITTTTTTRTLLISRPVELILNDCGEIVSRRPLKLISKARSNSLDCVLNDNDDINSRIETAPLVTDSFRSVSTRSQALKNVVGDEIEFRFIDDSSISQSANERNSQSNFNNDNNLCNDCHNVLERNRNNTDQSAVIMPRKQIKDDILKVVSGGCKYPNDDKQMSIGRKKFNMDPKKGIEYLVDNRLLRHDPQEVAHFLYKGEGLNKTAIGDFLGEKNDFNEDVLKSFVALHDFTNLILVQALRQFLWSFRLPGEAQKIDRMMECFAQRYCQLNPDIFTNTDTCYVLSFAIIMLNTSLHNPSVKEKPTVEQFIAMNRGINNGGDLPRGLFESLYRSIRTEPFKIPQDDGNDVMHTFFNPDKEGWLWKQGGRYKSWKRRWFILNDNCLYYFEYTTDKEPRGIIPLENISVREVHDRSKPNCFELFTTGGVDIIKACKTDSEGKVVEGKHTVYRMSAATEEDQQEWIKGLTQSISHNPFYDLLVRRKKKALSKS